MFPQEHSFLLNVWISVLHLLIVESGMDSVWNECALTLNTGAVDLVLALLPPTCIFVQVAKFVLPAFRVSSLREHFLWLSCNWRTEFALRQVSVHVLCSFYLQLLFDLLAILKQLSLRPVHLLAHQVNPRLERVLLKLVLLLFSLCFSSLPGQFFLLLDTFLIKAFSIVKQGLWHFRYSTTGYGRGVVAHRSVPVSLVPLL
jgi:hypothetical protein